MNIVATAVIEFNGGGEDNAEYLAYVGLDNESNAGKTSFNPGDTPIILANFSDNIHVDEVVATCGNIVPKDAQIKELISQQVFTSRDVNNPSTFKLPVIPKSSSISFSPQADQFGILPCRIGKFDTSVSACGEVKYVADVEKTPFSAKFTNTFLAKRYELQPPTLSLSADETVNIIVVFYISLV